MSPAAETSTNNGDMTSSSPYWSRTLTALDQASSIFWNSRTSGLSEDVTLGWAEAATGAGIESWAKATKQDRRTREKQAKRRIIRGMNSHLNSCQRSEIRGQGSETPNAFVTAQLTPDL